MTTNGGNKELELQMIGVSKPDYNCFNCGSNNWWQRKDGNWVCGVCHPKPKE